MRWSEPCSLLLGLVVLLLLSLCIVLAATIGSLSPAILTSSVTVRASIRFAVLLELLLLLLGLSCRLQHLSTLLVRRRFGTLLVGLVTLVIAVMGLAVAASTSHGLNAGVCKVICLELLQSLLYDLLLPLLAYFLVLDLRNALLDGIDQN